MGEGVSVWLPFGGEREGGGGCGSLWGRTWLPTGCLSESQPLSFLEGLFFFALLFFQVDPPLLIPPFPFFNEIKICLMQSLTTSTRPRRRTSGLAASWPRRSTVAPPTTSACSPSASVTPSSTRASTPRVSWSRLSLPLLVLRWPPSLLKDGVFPVLQTGVSDTLWPS